MFIKKLAAKATFSSIFDGKSQKPVGREVQIETPNGNLRLPKNHPITRMVNHENMIVTEQDVTKMVDGGHYFIEGQENILDFRPNTHKKKIMSQNTLNQFTDTIGGKVLTKGPQRGMIRSERATEDLLIKIDGHDQFEHLQTTGLLTYSPFEDVNFKYHLQRLWCANGCTTEHPLLNSFAPVLNLPLENIDILFEQTKVQLKNTMETRLNQMKTSAASVADLQKVHSMIRSRINEAEKVSQILYPSLNKVDVTGNADLVAALNPAVFEDTNLAAQVASHLSEYELWNVLTQVQSHSKGSTFSDNDFNMKASDILFDGSELRKIEQMGNAPEVQLANDTEKMFFGL